jgi:hypothetical protein
MQYVPVRSRSIFEFLRKDYHVVHRHTMQQGHVAKTNQHSHHLRPAAMPPARGKKRPAASNAVASSGHASEESGVADDFVARLGARLAKRAATGKGFGLPLDNDDTTALKSALGVPFDAAVRQVPDGTPLRTELDAGRQRHLDALVEAVRSAAPAGGPAAAAASASVDVVSPAVLASTLELVGASGQNHATLARTCECPCSHSRSLLLPRYHGFVLFASSPHRSALFIFTVAHTHLSLDHTRTCTACMHTNTHTHTHTLRDGCSAPFVVRPIDHRRPTSG